MDLQRTTPPGNRRRDREATEAGAAGPVVFVCQGKHCRQHRTWRFRRGRLRRLAETCNATVLPMACQGLCDAAPIVYWRSPEWWVGRRVRRKRHLTEAFARAILAPDLPATEDSRRTKEHHEEAARRA